MSDFLSGLADRVAPISDAYYDDPAKFVRDCFEWRRDEGPTKYQLEILERVPSERRVSVRGPRGLGKTCLSSWVLLWFALTREQAGDDWKAGTTAGSWTQLTKFFWPEVHKWARVLKWERLHRKPFSKFELMVQSLKLSYGEGFAAASDRPELMEGAHADQVLYIFDEAKSIPDRTWDSIEGTFSGAGAREGLDAFVLAISTPGEPLGRFYQIHQRAKGYDDWWPRHVKVAETIAAKQLDPEWVERQRLKFGTESAHYKNHVEGEFWSADEDGTIPLAWVDQAMDRWYAAHPDCSPGAPHPDFVAARHVCDPGEFTCAGVDPARFGADLTAIAMRHGPLITEIRTYAKKDTVQVAGFVQGILGAHGGRAVVDVGGLGAGVVDTLAHDDRTAKITIPFNSSEGWVGKDRSGEIGFINKRAAAYWHLRELLDPANQEPIMLPPIDELRGELTTPRYKEAAGGKIQIEGKEDLRKRLGRSPDLADAVVYAFWTDLLKSKVLIAAPVSGLTGDSYWRRAG